jgi:hypothetical protein
MSSDPNSPCELLSVANEIEAGDLITALAAYDIEAFTVGGFTSGFKAEAPGNVQILVRRSDLDRAQAALAEIQQDEGDVDWSQVDVGEPEH